MTARFTRVAIGGAVASAVALLALSTPPLRAGASDCRTAEGIQCPTTDTVDPIQPPTPPSFPRRPVPAVTTTVTVTPSTQPAAKPAVVVTVSPKFTG
jgi:hypothetical protein